jgi:hypothetical protein
LLLRVSNASLPLGLGRFRLSLCRRCHESDHRVADGLLDRVFGRTIERHRVDDRFHDHTFVHQMPDRRGGVVVGFSQADRPNER